MEGSQSGQDCEFEGARRRQGWCAAERQPPGELASIVHLVSFPFSTNVVSLNVSGDANIFSSKGPEGGDQKSTHPGHNVNFWANARFSEECPWCQLLLHPITSKVVMVKTPRRARAVEPLILVSGPPSERLLLGSRPPAMMRVAQVRSALARCVQIFPSQV
jgi:hypothetical protein